MLCVGGSFRRSFVDLAGKADRDIHPHSVAVLGLFEGCQEWPLGVGGHVARLGAAPGRIALVAGGIFEFVTTADVGENALIKEFREFINRGNLVDLAVAFVLGVAFASVVTVLTARIVSPLIGMVFDLSGLENMGTFGPADPETGIPVGSVGAFVEALINFVIVGFVMFLVVRAYNKSRKPEPEPEPEADPEDVVLLRRIAQAVERS